MAYSAQPMGRSFAVRLLRRIVLTIVCILAILYILTQWVAPVALSYYAAEKAPAIIRVVPVALNDLAVSDAPGLKLTYVGYEFEVPWNDLDESQTKLYPEDKSKKTRVILSFSSGLRLMVTSLPARELVNSLPEDFNVSPQKLESAFGRATMSSDYDFNKTVYEFTPDKMDHWHFRGPVNRDEFLLIIKSMILSSAASSGIFNIQTKGLKGFQQGNPQTQAHSVLVSLYSDKRSVEMVFERKDYRMPVGITQPEVNRVIQSLRPVSSGEIVPQPAR
jgi:hypothetical protein